MLCRTLALATLLLTLAAARSLAGTPEETIRGFYQWYVTTLNADRDPFSRSERATFQRYVSTRLIRWIDRMRNRPDGPDYDYFLNAQEVFNEWAVATVESIRTRGSSSTAQVRLGSGNSAVSLRVTLKKERGGWRIDKVKGA